MEIRISDQLNLIINYSREEAMSDKGVCSIKCPVCRTALRKKVMWFSSNTKKYYCVAKCPFHGHVRGKIQMKKFANDPHMVFPIKIVKPISDEDVEKELNLIRKCRERNMGFIGMKSLAGGLITNAEAAMAFTAQFDNLMPIWGVQKMSELEEWLSYMDKDVQLTPEISAFIEKERKELAGDFCRGCGYCMPCPVGILINNCARMSLLLRRAPSAAWLSEENQAEMMKIDQCLHCYQCASRCPYGLDTPHLLEKNLEDYKKVLAGEVSVA